ncbi:hypothetical protein [Entomohabitans teleogrylli]|uniref:hypothetical protein n=1 Tax=Entomohabitans teleogrylli TaxID=1384589 RepID=UPI00073D3C3B|nr:hypothetical protein [Entomohabitans teleogrylli]
MPGDTLRASGKRCIEIKQRIFFPQKASNKPFQTENYHIETWLFFPSSLQINRWTYPPQAFQQNLKNYIRLRPPTLMLRKLAADVPGTLANIEQLLAEHSKDISPQGYEYRLKMFCLTFKRALHVEVRYILRLGGEKREQALISFTAIAADILAGYRRMRERVAPGAQANALRIVDYGDEFLALMITHYGRKLLNSLAASPGYDSLRAFWREQMLYRKNQHPDTFPSPGSDNELVIYRVNTLKKYISSPMYLDIRRKKGETFLAHTIAGIAAAIAMIFATAVAFIWQGKYGALSMQLFLAMVIGYIFKDRMKEGFRARLFSTFRRWLPDRQQEIYKNLRYPVGKCNESFVFVDESQLPGDVKAMRRKVHILDIQNYYLSEDILHYSKHVQLRASNQLFTGVNRSVMDITRLDITPFLKYTDELLNELPTLDDDQVLYGEKVYHINLIRRVTDGKESTLERARIIINSAGIKRIEPVFVTTEEPEDGEG